MEHHCNKELLIKDKEPTKLCYTIVKGFVFDFFFLGIYNYRRDRFNECNRELC